jgi:cyanophycinase-like exopeptidase
MSARLLTIMGSGETAPTMVKLHRQVYDRLGPGPHDAVFLDTPFGFQENASELCERTVTYFRQSVGHDISVAGLPRVQGADALTAERGLTTIRRAELLFAGPGSPTYTLRQWSGTPVGSILRERLSEHGAVTFSSAAALTLGTHTVPVYEIYKVGADPYWLEGLDVVSALGLRAVVIPHYDNAEGGHHDTRFCYLGERRLSALERELPDDVFVLGVDEHTGIVIDLDADEATVWGRGGVTLRRRDGSTVIPAGETVPVDVLRSGGAGPRPGTAPGPAASEPTEDGPDRHGPGDDGDRDGDASPASLQEETRVCEGRFTAALAAGDAPGAAAAALALETAIVEWSRDTLQSDEVDRARAALRAMIVELGEAAVAGLADPRAQLAPVVEAALAVRRVVRGEKRFDLSDLVRDELARAGVEVRDTPDGVDWQLQA